MHAPVPKAPAAPVEPPTPVVEVPVVAPPAPVVVPEPIAPVVETPVVAPTPVAPPVAEAVRPVPKRPASAPPIPTAPIVPPVAIAPPAGNDARPPRKTITLADMRPPQHVPERKVVIPAPKLLIPKPATIQGPNIVREEAPDHVAPLRPKGPRTSSGGGTTDSPSFVQARAKGGGGCHPG